METKAIRVSLVNHKRLADIGHKTDSFNDIISKLLNDYEEYQEYIFLHWKNLMHFLMRIKYGT